MPRRPVTSADVERITLDGAETASDLVAVEEPLQVILEHGDAHVRCETPLAVTMRTPGHDPELVIGFLFAEGVIAGRADLVSVRHCVRAEPPGNVVRAVLAPGVPVPAHLLERRLNMTSACGVCGERTLEALEKSGCSVLPPSGTPFQPGAIRAAIAALEAAQAWFRHTGGTHGAALFDGSGALLLHREDVGRHNALDKLVGASMASGPAPHDAFIVVSSRASFELVQKSVRAGISMMVAIGAPTSLAIETAERFNLTLVGFAKRTRFNVYAGAERIARDEQFIDVGAAE
jgi:FdhD protein